MATMKTRNGLYAEMGRYYVAASGTGNASLSDLDDFIHSLDLADMLDSCIIINADTYDSNGMDMVYLPWYVANDGMMCYCYTNVTASGDMIETSYYFNGNITNIQKTVNNGTMSRVYKRVSDSTLNVSKWKLYLRK